MARSRRRFGQHFLEPVWAERVVRAINPAPHDRFIEIGPGRGEITVPLAARVDRVVAVEIDRDLAAGLQARALPNLTVITADVLEVDLVAIAREMAAAPSTTASTGVVTTASGPPRIRVAGNLPYNISSPVLFALFDAARSGLFVDATLVLQREVAERLTASPGTGEYGVLTVSAQLSAEVTHLLSLPPGAFRPMPKVHSAVVRLAFRPPPPEVRHPALVVEIVRSVFMQRRKTMANALAAVARGRGRAAGDVLVEAGIDPRRRPETLNLLEFSRLADVLARGPSKDHPDGPML